VLAGLVEKDDIAVRIAQARLAPHPGLVPGAMFERDSAPSELLDAFVQVVTFEVDRRRRDDFFFGIDLDRKGHTACRFKAGVAGIGTIDDLTRPIRL